MPRSGEVEIDISEQEESKQEELPPSKVEAGSFPVNNLLQDESPRDLSKSMMDLIDEDPNS